MNDSEEMAKEARKHTRYGKPIHRTKFQGSPIVLMHDPRKNRKGFRFGKWIDLGNGRQVLVYEQRRG